MKKFYKSFYFILILSTLILPILPVLASPTTAQPVDVIVSTGYSAGTDPVRGWDPAHYQPHSALLYYLRNCLEQLITVPYDWDGSWDDINPVLATDWSVEWRANDSSHSGGIKAMNFTLRDNVQFHDGSEWNSTVAAWNLDRTVWRSGGFGAGKPGPLMLNMWFKASDLAPYFTPEWNFTWAIGQNATYGGVTNTVAGDGMNGYVSWINKTIAVDPLTLRIEFNAWNPKPFAMLSYEVMGYAHEMISMETYATNYTMANIPKWDSTDVAHFVGTGPYEFVEHDTVGLGGGTIIRNDDWWNATAMQAIGFHEVTEGRLVAYVRGPEGELARQLALMSGDIDLAIDLPSAPVDFDQVDSSVNHEYEELGVWTRLGPAIFLNCINESAYWTNPAVIHSPIPALGGATAAQFWGNPNGIPRAIRQALTYAYDYVTFRDTEKEGRAVRAGGILGVNNEHYNPSVNLPDQDLATARAKMLAAYPTNCSDRGLDGSSTNAEWINIGETNPIWSGVHHTEARFEEVNGYLILAANQIGCNYSLVDHPNGVFPDINKGLMPLLGSSSFAINLPIPPVYIYEYLKSYLQSTTLPAVLQGRSRNFVFLDNATINGYLDEIYLNNGTKKQEAFDDFAYDIQNYHCPIIFTVQPYIGIAYTNEWEYHSFASYYEIMWIKQVDWTWIYPDPAIPGYSIPIVMALSIVSMLAIVYHMKRKNRLN